MKVGLLHYTGPPTVGGVEQTLGHHAQQLAAAGHQAVLVVGAGSLSTPGVTLRVLPRLHSRHPEVMEVKAELDLGHVTSRFAGLADEVRREVEAATRDLQVLIVHNALSLHKNLALTAALWQLHRSGAWPRLIGWHHDLAWERAEYDGELHPGEPWDLLRRPWPGVLHVAVSESLRQQLAELTSLSPESITVIPPGVEPEDFLRLSPATRALQATLGLARADLVLLYPTRLTRRKNIEKAISIAAATAAGSGLDVRLIVTGPPGPHNAANETYLGELTDLCRRLGVEGRIHLLHRLDPDAGGVDEATLAELFSLADALLLTSRAEGFGIPILEAGLARLPVFCSDIPPFRESGRDDVTFLSLDATPEEAAQKIVTVLDRDNHHRLRQRVRREFTWAGLVQQRLLPLLETEPHA
jgi:glycosyltransferase involved in cell wall biosynthesis